MLFAKSNKTNSITSQTSFFLPFIKYFTLKSFYVVKSWSGQYEWTIMDILFMMWVHYIPHILYEIKAEHKNKPHQSNMVEC